ncbi:MAG: glycosyltransferase family 1 protein [Candidatus Omnitrophota bacterium]|nr:glycosyltransferase family 1 protein [Candidatus Omnitrophota bacterium]
MEYEIGFDVRMMFHTGIGTYIRGLLRHMLSFDPAGKLGMCLYGDSLRAEGFDGVPRSTFGSKIYSVAEQWEYPGKLRQCRLWHAPHYNIPLRKGKTKLIVTVHDLIHWIFRKQFFSPLQALYAGEMMKRVVKTADHIITVSENTKHDLITHFNAEPEQISVIYEAVEEGFGHSNLTGEDEAVHRKYGLPENYFLYVGSIKPHKNVVWLINLFRELKREGRTNASLVLVGKKDQEFESGDGVYHIPSVDREELEVLYRGALSLVHPSIYEGFGLTLLEAMACETPVIAKRAASIPEVVGAGARLVDPSSDVDWKQAMHDVEFEKGVRSELSAKGSEQLKRFRWQDTARQTLDIYERILSRP